MPEVFGERSGRGPLLVAWDTNILLDYFEHGGDMWEGRTNFPSSRYGEELTALEALMQAAFPWREFWIWVTETQVEDAKCQLSDARVRRREEAIVELLSALGLAERGLATKVSGHDIEFLMQSLTFLPEGMDRQLVAEAITAGCHVFLTRDRSILRQHNRLRHVIALMSPTALLDELAYAGELLPVTSSILAGALVPDLQRISHLIEVAEPAAQRDAVG